MSNPEKVRLPKFPRHWLVVPGEDTRDPAGHEHALCEHIERALTTLSPTKEGSVTLGGNGHRSGVVRSRMPLDVDIDIRSRDRQSHPVMPASSALCSVCSHIAHPTPPAGQTCGCYDPQGICALTFEDLRTAHAALKKAERFSDHTDGGQHAGGPDCLYFGCTILPKADRP